MSNTRLGQLGPRMPRIVGRAEELERLHGCLHARGESHVVYYWARGGLGKTRLLEELQRLVQEAGAGYHSTPVIDLYHTDTHSTSDVERAIVEGLDPNHKYFFAYRRDREAYEILRERGIDPHILEERRAALNKLFVRDYGQMALDARKLVICFDTVELLQHEVSVIEEMAGQDTTDTRLKPWLLNALDQLANVLVVFAGRPVGETSAESGDLQARFIADLERAFGDKFTAVELQPFTLEETRGFILELTGEKEVIPEQYLPIVHRLTGGRPIFLHLIVDLVRVLAVEPQEILALFGQYAHLVDAPEEDAQLAEARRQIEIRILNSIFHRGASGEYLRYMALMPKGIEPEMLQKVLGLPKEEAEQLLEDLRPLSFVKQFKPPPGAERLHGERVFLHDEMYRLLTRPDVMPNLRINERYVAQSVITNYYDPLIKELEQQLGALAPEQRVPLRERLQKLQVECLYYLLVCDPARGYAEYKRLSDQANRRRWIGFGMRLLDEFLRFYNARNRRLLFAASGLRREQIIRDSALMWVERFHWWGQRERELRFTYQLLQSLRECFIDPKKDTAALGVIYAFRMRALAMRTGYDPKVVEEAQAILDRLPLPDASTSEELLARARLSTSLGYQLDEGGFLTPAAEMYLQAKAAFLKMGDDLGNYRDEYAMLLNNLAYLYARQGKMLLARPLAHEALQINEEIGNEYSTGLTLSTLSQIALMRENYAQALGYAEEALKLVKGLQDAHGMALAYVGIARARRRMVRHELEKGRGSEDSRRQLERTLEDLESALQVAQQAQLNSDTRELRAERGRVYRDLGHVVSRLEDPEKGLAYYRQSESELRQTLQALATDALDAVGRADLLQDLAEVLTYAGDEAGAERHLRAAEQMIGVQEASAPDQQPFSGALSAEAHSVLRKAEMLRAHMAFTKGQLAEGLQHYVLAYASLVQFTPDAPEKNAMVEYLYNYFRGSPVQEQQQALASTRTWISERNLGSEAASILDILENLIGV